ncbi:MAG: hypothetical protein QW598_00725 [Pyrobaculum sp.]
MVLVGAGVVGWILARRARMGCPSDLNALRRVLEEEFDDVYVDRVGNLMLVKGRTLFFTIKARVDCASGRHSLSWPWPIPFILLFVPGLGIFALLLLLWLADEAETFRKVLREASNL